MTCDKLLRRLARSFSLSASHPRVRLAFAWLCLALLGFASWQFPEEEELCEALKSQGQWSPQVLAVLAVPLVREERRLGLGLGLGWSRGIGTAKGTMLEVHPRSMRIC